MKTDELGFITELDKNEVFVFGSNLAGMHVGGAAKTAKDKFGAIEGVGVGLQGDSYAIPTLDQNFNKLPLETIGLYLHQLARIANLMPNKRFCLTTIGTGIAGYSHDDMQSIMPSFPKNIRRC